MEDLDPEEARAIVDPALKLMIDAVHRYEGYVVQSTGDGIFALFGAPVAHEDHPQRALYSALRMQEELKRYSDRIRAEGGFPIQARVGVNTGEVVVRSITLARVRSSTHRLVTPLISPRGCSRFADWFHRGERTVTQALRRLLHSQFAGSDQGQRRQRAGQRLRSDRVGTAADASSALGGARADEVRRTRARDGGAQACRREGQVGARADRRGDGRARRRQIAPVLRVQGDFAIGMDGAGNVSVSHGKASAYLPVLDLLQGYFKIAGDDDERTRREKVAGKITILERGLEDTLPYLFSLLGIVEGEDPLAQMDGQSKKRRTLKAIKRIVLRESLNRPLMVIFKDLHWIDEATQEFLNLLADSIGTGKILLLINYRPEYSHQWNSKTYYTQLRLDPLGKESAEEMLSALLGYGVEVAALKRVIIEKTEATRSSSKRPCRCCSMRVR